MRYRLLVTGPASLRHEAGATPCRSCAPGALSRLKMLDKLWASDLKQFDHVESTALQVVLPYPTGPVPACLVFSPG